MIPLFYLYQPIFYFRFPLDHESVRTGESGMDSNSRSNKTRNEIFSVFRKLIRSDRVKTTVFMQWWILRTIHIQNLETDSCESSFVMSHYNNKQINNLQFYQKNQHRMRTTAKWNKIDFELKNKTWKRGIAILFSRSSSTTNCFQKFFWWFLKNTVAALWWSQRSIRRI